METSGFFESEYDESTLEYDREYYAYQFAKYFSLFIGNGVFANPVNQLKVVASTSGGLKVVLKPGWAFINGYWYNNDSDKELSLSVNSGVSNRIDSVKIRYNSNTRKISGLYFEDETSVSRSEAFYDLKIAEVVVEPSSSSISDENITDTRALSSVCGFVSGLVDLTDTEDLFKQYDIIFENWFKTLKTELSGDVAGNLLNMIGTLANLKTDNKSDLVNAVNEIFDTYLPLKGGVIDNSNVEEVLQIKGKDNCKLGFYNQVKKIGNIVFNDEGSIELNSNGKVLLLINSDGVAKINDDVVMKEKNNIDSLSTIKSNIDSGKTAGALAVKELAGNVTKIIYSTEEPTTVQEGTIVAVYE